MGFFSRLSNIVSMRANAALDKHEDAGQVMDYAYSKQLEQLQILRKSIADVVTNEKRLEMQQTTLQKQADKLQGQAVQALQSNREDLARLALQKKEHVQMQIQSYTPQLEQIRAQREHLIGMEQQVAARIESFRTQKEMVKAQYNAAQAQVKVNEAVTGISQEMGETNLAMQRAQDKMLSMQARADATEVLLQEGRFDDPAMLGVGDSLDRELHQISAQQNIDAQLQAMKQQVQLNGPSTQQRQIDRPGDKPLQQ